MGAKPKQVGGSPTAPLAQGFTSFLQSSMPQVGSSSSSLLAGQGGANGNLAGMYNLNQYQPGSVSAPQIDLSQFSQGLGTSFNQPGLNLGQYTTQLNQTPQIGNYQQTQAPSADINGAYANALQGVLQNSMTQNVNSLRQQYSAGGLGGQSTAGSPAANAEAIYRANALPQLASSLGNYNLQQGALDLQNTGLNQSGVLGTQQLQSNNALGNTSLGIGQNSNLLQTLLGQSGQNITAGLGGRNADISQLGLLGNLAQSNASNNLSSQNTNLASILQQLSGAQNYNLGLGQQALSGQTSALQNYFSSLMQGNQLGTPQAQMIQQPSTFQNIMSGVTGLAGAAAPFFL